MGQRRESQVGKENSRLQQLKENWKGLAIGVLSFYLPLTSGLVNTVFCLSTIPIKRWVTLLIGGMIFAIGAVLLVPTWKVSFKGSSRLVTNGIYAHLRHPHYLSNMIWGFSCTLLLNSWWSFLIFIVSLPIIYRLILLEEKELADKYGEEYERYRERVPMFLPRILGR
jgi:protein-S-isoprenylcysteine O-methyltransferase Ste14